MAGASLWLPKAALILASRSSGRRMVLEAARILVECVPADIDERAIERGLSTSQTTDMVSLSLALAREKALEVSRRFPDRFVLGCDQVLSCDGRILHKASNLQEAREQLAFLSGRMHELHSAAALVKAGEILAAVVDKASMLMRHLSDDLLDAYVELDKDVLLNSVGGYAIEGSGSQLFASIQGDHFTIIGIPLLPVLEVLRNEGLLLR